VNHHTLSHSYSLSLLFFSRHRFSLYINDTCNPEGKN
jgi:hypothetical protein